MNQTDSDLRRNSEKDKASRSFMFKAVKGSRQNKLDNRSEAVSAIGSFNNSK